MPNSKSRHPHHSKQVHHPAQITTKHVGAQKTSRVVKLSIFIFALFGLLVGYFMSPDSWVTIIIVSIVSAVAGYFFGHQIEKSLKRKS